MQRRPRFKRPIRKPDDLYRINERIRAEQIRLVGENTEPRICSPQEALLVAKQMDLDLVEISPNAKPPVCKIMDYKKFLYEKKKREKEIKAKTQKTVIKEIRFTPNTDDHDFDFKAKHAEKFLKEGSKVKCYVQFRGRAIVFKDRGELILLKFAQRLEDFATVEQLPKLEGRRMTLFLSPKKKKK